MNWRGDTLKGKITITQKHGYMMQGSERTVVLDSLEINNIELRGTRTVTCQGYNVNDYTIIRNIKLTHIAAQRACNVKFKLNIAVFDHFYICK